LKDWIVQNLSDPDDYERFDFEGEIDPALSFQENVNLLHEKFPGAFRDNQPERTAPKQLIMPEWLIVKVEKKEKACTFRPRALEYGQKYYLVPNRFRGLKDAKVVIRILEVETIENPNALSDEEARWTGLRNREELYYWFKKWYSKKYPPDGRTAIKYRNWFCLADDEIQFISER
jgi:hypothetical protein